MPVAAMAKPNRELTIQNGESTITKINKNEVCPK